MKHAVEPIVHIYKANMAISVDSAQTIGKILGCWRCHSPSFQFKISGALPTASVLSSACEACLGLAEDFEFYSHSINVICPSINISTH